MRAAAFLALAACGRVGFDARGDATSDAGIPLRLDLPAGGELDRITQGPSGTWYAVSSGGTVYRSDDGVAWTPCGDVYATDVTEDFNGDVYASGADVHLSTDRCATWQATGIDRFTESVAATSGGVFALADIGLRKRSGNAWMPITTPLDGARFNELTWRTGAPFLIATNSGLLYSGDTVTWQAVTTGLATNNALDVATSATRTYTITAASGASVGGVGCSDGSAQTWSTCFGEGGTAIAVDPGNDQHVLVAVYDLLMESTDAMQTEQFDKRGGEMGAALVQHMAWTTSGLMVATDRGAYFAAPGTLTWQSRHTGLDAWNVYDVARAGDDIYLATEGGVIHGATGQPYTASFAGMTENTEVFAVAVLPDGTPLAAGRHVYTSADHGATWTQVIQLGAGDKYRAFSIAVDGTRAYVGTATQLYRADPPYTTWTPLMIAGGFRNVLALHVTGGALWIATDAGLYTTTDQGATFQQVAGVATTPLQAFGELADGTLIVGDAQDGTWISDGGRTSWQHAGPAGRTVYKIATTADAIVVSTDQGVYASHDRGATWIAGALPYSMRAVFVDPADGQIVVGPLGRGLVKTAIP